MARCATTRRRRQRAGEIDIETAPNSCANSLSAVAYPRRALGGSAYCSEAGVCGSLSASMPASAAAFASAMSPSRAQVAASRNQFIADRAGPPVGAGAIFASSPKYPQSRRAQQLVAFGVPCEPLIRRVHRGNADATVLLGGAVLLPFGEVTWCREGNRTPTLLPELDFESSASTNSAIPAGRLH